LLLRLGLKAEALAVLELNFLLVMARHRLTNVISDGGVDQVVDEAFLQFIVLLDRLLLLVLIALPRGHFSLGFLVLASLVHLEVGLRPLIRFLLIFSPVDLRVVFLLNELTIFLHDSRLENISLTMILGGSKCSLQSELVVPLEALVEGLKSLLLFSSIDHSVLVLIELL